MANRRSYQRDRKVLLVHSDMAVVMQFHTAFSANGYVPIIARDLPSALLAMTQHFFEGTVISSQINEPGDGWPLGGVFRMVFPRAFVAVIAPDDTVQTLQTAINNGVSQVFEMRQTPEQIMTSVMTELSVAPPTEKRASRRIQ